MSGPTSLQRAPSCCQHCYYHHNYNNNNRNHNRRHDHSNRDRDDNEHQCNDKLQVVSCPRSHVDNWRASRTCIDERLNADENNRHRQKWNSLNERENKNDEREENRVLVDYEVESKKKEEKVDEPRLFSTLEVSIQEKCYETRRRQRTTEIIDGDRENEHTSLTRCCWQVDCRDLSRQQPCRRNGRGRGFAANIFFLATASAFFALAVVLPPVSGTSSGKVEATRTRMGGSGTGTTLTETPTNVRADRIDPTLLVDTRTESSYGGKLTGSIDLLAALELYNTTRNGVSRVTGLATLTPAYYLQGEERDLRLNKASFERAAALLRRVPEFTVVAALRQDIANSGTIVAFSHGNNRYLELQSSGRKDELRLHYVSRRDGAVHVEAFPFRLADGEWHRLALSISGSQVELLVDCHPLYRRLLRPGPPDTNFTLPQLQLWVGQRNAKHFLFKGALQDVKLIPGAHGYLSQCPQLDTSCPTCGQFSMLQNTVEQLMHNLNELTRRLAAAEGRMSKVEECECQKSCRANGTVYADGATWDKGCTQCSCVHGEIECRPTPCAPVDCENPVVLPGQCCRVCLKQCMIDGKLYDHGVRVSPVPCSKCNCFDGSFTCERFDREKNCPPLPCSPEEQISVAEECCKFCPGVDYCAKGHECHANASCLNLKTTYACHCNIGYQGDGHKCHDVDECKQQGGLVGHHCNANTRCVNVEGSYTCECLSGYHRIDKFNCGDVNECTTGSHSCNEHATCINTIGSYYCVCNDGYTGDGNTCKPKCEQSCQNAGECVAPGRCSCRRGYIGNSCELDLDECASDLHRCHHSSTCFNMPGWYYCRCKPGYRSALHESNQGTQCVDINECNDRTIEGKHTCHPTARCLNTDGGYQCRCPIPDENRLTHLTPFQIESLCNLGCWYENREIANGETFEPAGNSCRQCSCKDGVVTCRDPICDCSLPGSRLNKCCPQCNPAASCRHQELHHLVFRSGERWIYQCQTCECLYGEIDCWQMECPPVTCLNPVTEDGDCCPRCEDDPCARELPGVVSTNGSSDGLISPWGRPQPCSYGGLLHDSGSSWQDFHDKCTTCECKDGQLCCSYDYRCAGDLEDSRESPIVSGKPESGNLPRGSNALRKNIDSSKTTLSTAQPDFSDASSISSTITISSSSSSSSSISSDEGRSVSSGIRTTSNGLYPETSFASISPISVSSEAIASSILTKPFDNSDLFKTNTDNVPSVSQTTVKTPRADRERVSLSLPASPSPSSSSTQTPTSIGSGSIASAGNKLTGFKNIQTARYSTSNLNDRKTSFASGSRRRGDRGPRLINGYPSGHDAT